MASLPCACAALILPLVAAAPEPPTPWPAGLMPGHRYVTLNRPLTVAVNDPQARQTLAVTMIHADGGVIEGPVAVPVGFIQLGDVFPSIWTQRRACYVQLLDGQTPIGPALVVEPMLSRLPPRTEQALRADGVTKYTRIIGWGKIAEKKAEPASHITEKSATKPDAAATAGGSDTTPPDESLAIEPQVFSGFRLYVDQDVILHTSVGDIRLALAPDEAPHTVWNFRQLAADGFYDGLTFHRVVPFRADGTRFVVQGGDPNGNGEGGPGWWLPLEPSNLRHDFGTIGMARDDHPDSAGSQFFIGLSREGTRHLDTQYCAFAYAVEGAKTVRALAEVELADVTKGRPANPPVITRAELVPAPPRMPGQGRPDRKIEDDISSPAAPAAPTPEAATQHPGRVPR